MVGLMQKILIQMIADLAGEEGIRQVKALAKVPNDREFQMNTVYSDEEWQRLFDAALQILKITPEQAYQTYANYFGADAIKRFPTWFRMSKNSYEFLSIQPTIHNCFATSMVDVESRRAINDKFRVEQLPNQLITHYRSPNKLCGLYKTLALWVINYYQDETTITEKKCLKLGDDECEIHIRWTKLGT